MRRLAAVFSKRDKSDSHPQSDHSHPPSSQPFKKQLKLPLPLSFVSSIPPVQTPSSITSTPQLSSVSDHGQSSGSSSGSASLSLPTPEEDFQATSLARNSTRRSWKDWLGVKRSEPDPPVPLEHPKLSNRDRPIPVWDERPHTLQGPQTRAQAHKEVDDRDEESSEVTDDEESVSTSDHPRPLIPKHTFVPSPGRARQNLELLINHSLNPPLPTSPFVQHYATHLFPRSCNRPSPLPMYDTRRVMFRRRLLKRLENLTGDDEEMILPFASKTVPTRAPAPLPSHESIHPSKTTCVFSASPGVRRWISRPCFEDRFSIFLPSRDGIHQTPVVGKLAVTALEYSEYLDVIVDPDFDPSLPPPESPQDIPWAPSLQDFSPNQTTPVGASNDTSLQPAAANVRHTYIPSPSPLRNQHNSDASLSESTSQSTIIAPLSASSQTNALPMAPTVPRPLAARPPAAAPVKRVVRFVEEDAEDVMPLHLVRQKKKQEEKAKFLRAEQRKRVMEQEQERRRLEAEAIEQEKRQLAREKERKEIEQRQFTELVASTRARRETQRAGIVPGLKTDGNGNLLTSPSTTSLRETERNRTREAKRSSLIPHHSNSSSSIPRREDSDSGLTPPYPYSAETSSYRTGSGGYSPGGSTSGHGHPSRPGSTYSSSSEGGRPSSKRHSNISSNFDRPLSDRTASYLMWSGSNSSLHHISSVPGLPVMPELMNDFVLLPPSAPFMMQSGRQSRNSSPGRSTSSGSLRGSANSSSERVHIYSQASRPKETSSAPASPGTSPSRMDSRPTHVKQGGGDSRRASMPLPSNLGSGPRSQPHSFTRGRESRPPLPHAQTVHGAPYLQSPNPWTALPTQNGYLPTAMPVSPYSHPMGSNTFSKGSVSSGTRKGKGV